MRIKTVITGKYTEVRRKHNEVIRSFEILLAYRASPDITGKHFTQHLATELIHTVFSHVYVC